MSAAPPPRRKESVNARAFRALLALYPAAFRDEYGRELTLVFIDRYRHATGAWDRTRLWVEALTGILLDSPREHHRMILQDLRYASRMLRQHALVTLTIVVTLGLGIGANTAIFSVMNAVMLRALLPVADADQLLTVNAGSRIVTGAESARFSGQMYERLRQTAPQGVGVAAMSRGVARVYTRTADAPDTTPASLQLVSSSFFPVIGVSPAIGRMPTEEEGAGAPVAVISYAYWQRQFGGAPDVVGRPLTINGASFTIVGVGPRDFGGVWLELPVDIWVPLTMQRAVKYSQDFTADGVDSRLPWMQQPKIWWLYVIVRTPPAHAAATLTAFGAGLSDLAGQDVKVVLEPFGRGFSKFRQRFLLPLYALTVMAALVLLIACANVANLLLARALARQREIAVRMALGAGRLRLFHQLLTESILLVLMAGAAAMTFAQWAGNLLVRTATATTSDGAPPFKASIDWRVLMFTAGVAFVAVILFGLMPAWRATRLDVNGALKTSARGALAGAARPARLLVIVQVALSFILVVGTGLFVRSFQHLLQVDLGFDRAHVVSVAIDPRLSGPTPQALAELHQRVLDAALAVPGVQSASLAMCGIQAGCRAREDGIEIEGYRPRQGEDVIFVVNGVSPSYFSTVGMRVIAGRSLNDRDLSTSPRVAVVNRILATTYFPNGDAVGKRFGEDAPDVEIVGVVEDARLMSVKEAAVPAAYFPLMQRPTAARSLDVRTSGDPQQTIAALRQAIRAAAPDLPIEGIVTMEERVQRGLSEQRVVVLLTFAFGALALGLAGFGLFGVLSYAVVRRTPEFGLRMALGAPRAHVLQSVLRDALWLVVCGVIIGAPFVFLGGRLASTLVFGISPYDAISLVTAVIVLITVGIACSMMPALRASRVDPMVALRQD